MKKIILASNSPRRKEILKIGKIDFTVVKSNYEEDVPKFYNEAIIKKNSLNKALDVSNSIDYAATIIGADTMVILVEGKNSVCLIKPQNYDEAFFMLKNLSHKTHKVVTSISLLDSVSGKNMTEIEETFVTFRTLYDDEIKKYIDNFKPFDKAGSYGIQDFVSIENIKNPPKESFIQKIEGDYYNVMGISLDKLNSMLKRF